MILKSIFSRSAKGNVFEALGLTFPLVLAMAANAINQFLDRLFLSHYSDLAIQASLPGGMLGWVFLALAISIVGYSGTFVAQYNGAERRRGCVCSLAQGLWLAIAIYPFLLAMILVGPYVFGWFGHPEALAREEMTYYRIMMIGSVLVTVPCVFSGYFAGQGRTKLVGIASFTGNVVNVFLNYVMIFGKFGCPEMGIAGAAWATNVSQVVICAIFVTALVRDRNMRFHGLPALFRFRPELMKKIVRYGVPGGVQNFIDCVSFTIFVMLTGKLDAMSLAVSNIAFSVNHLSFAPFQGMSNAAGIMVGNYQGEGDHEAAKRSGWSCIALSWTYFAIFAIVVLVGSDFIMGAFYESTSSFDRESYCSLGRILMAIMIGWGVFDATDIILSGALRGAGDTHFVMYAFAGISIFIWMPVFLLVMWLVPSIVALWSTMPFYCGLCALTIVMRWMSGKWMNIGLIKGGRK